VGFKNRFDAGELDKWCLGAIDDPVYQRGAALVENFRQLENGGLNRRAGYKFIAPILAGTGDKAVKLVPAPVDETTNYIIYVSKSKYGYLKFNGYELVKQQEKDGPAPFVVPGDHKVRHRVKDPSAYYTVEAVSGFSSVYGITEGTESKLVLGAARESALVKTGAGVPAGEGLFLEASGFVVTPQYVFGGVNRDIPQGETSAEGSSYFEETGIGAGLQLTFDIKTEQMIVPEIMDKFSVVFFVQTPGSGYGAVAGTSYTWLDIRHGRFPGGRLTVKAEVSNGSVKSVESAEYAGPPADDVSQAVPDYCGVLKGSGAVVNIRTTPVFGSAGQAPLMEIRAEVKSPGSGYFGRGGAAAIDVRLYRETAGFAYGFSVPCIPDESGGLHFEGGDVKTVVTDARLVKEPPDNMAAYTVQGAAEDVFAEVTALVVKNTEEGRWDVAVEVVRNEAGAPVSSGNWTAGASYTLDGNPGGAVTAVMPYIYYPVEITDKGKYKRDPAGQSGAASFGGVSVFVEVTASAFVESSLLSGIKNPDTGVYEVEEDETMGMISTCWEWKEGGWVEKTRQSLPLTDEAVKGMQYVYNGKFTVFAGRGFLPFILEIDGDDEIGMGAFDIKTAADYVLSAPDDFEAPENTPDVPGDPAVPAGFCRNLAASPSVVYYDGGRWWFASTPDDPSRIWVSRPAASRGEKEVNFSTYRYFLTVTPKLDAFTGESAPFSDRISNVDAGAAGLAAAGLAGETSGGDLSFGYIKPRILAMTYFPDGADVLGAAGDLVLSAANVPKAGEYTAAAAAGLRADCAHRVAVAKASYAVPYGTGVISASADGYTVTIGASAAGLFLGLGSSGGFVSGGAGTICEFAGWGKDNVSGYLSAAAMGASVALALPATSAWGGVAAAGALMGLRAAFAALIRSGRDALKLSMTNGETRSDFSGDFIIHSALLLDKTEYLLARYKLYEPRQPFVLRRWNVEETKYSTVECGFTFTFSSDEEETVNLITGNRSFFVSTNSSERCMPETVSGEAQSSRTGSFYGSERLQPAKGGDSVFFLQKGGQRVMRAYWQPDTPVPSIADLQRYNRAILENKKVISLKSSKAVPVSVWCVLSDGTAAVLTDAQNSGFFSWSRVTTGAGGMLDTAALPMNGASHLRIIAADTPGGIFICGTPEGRSGPGDIFLDGWQEYVSAGITDMYDDSAVVYDKETGTVYAKDRAPPPAYGLYIGYRYMTKFRTLPSPRQDMGPARIARVRIRFLESVMPYIRGFPSGRTDKVILPGGDRYVDGIADVPVPGNVERDAAFEVFTDEPEPLSVICLFSEED
jgi:hypothetical protein